MKGEYRASFSQFDITPNVSGSNPAYLQGMAGHIRMATEIETPLALQMCLLEDENYSKLLIVAADIIGFDRSIFRHIRDYADNWGIKPEGIMLNASHTHYAPGTLSNMPASLGPFYQAYCNQICQVIQGNLPHLYNALATCDLYVGKAVARIGANRRFKINGKVHFAPDAAGEYLTDTPFLKIVFPRAGKSVLWVNHGCHPTGMGPAARVSSDFPGYLRNALLSAGAADGVLFLQGPAGSSKQIAFNGDKVRFCSQARETKENGERLAQAVIHSLKKPLAPVHGPLFCVNQETDLPLKAVPTRDHLQDIFQNNQKAPIIKEWAGALLQRHPAGGFPATLPIQIQWVSIGDDVNLVTFPAEPVAELANAIKSLPRISGHDFILGYTNGLEGYLPSDRMIGEGGYEVEQSHFVYQQPSAFDTGTEKKVLQTIEHCLDQKEIKNRPNGYGRYHLATGSNKAFFVLSSGRCGTMTLAHLLNTAGNARVWHHPQPDPIKEALMAWWGKIDQQAAFWRIRSQVIQASWSQGWIHGETDLLMTPFCAMLAEEIPESKFIILVRNPKEFVYSGMRRNYYGGHSWDVGRLRPEAGSAFYEEWKKLDQFEKICWLWRETYERIVSMTARIPENRKRVVKFEDLVSSTQTTKDLFHFLGLEGFDEEKIKPILLKRLNSQKTGNFPRYDAWTPEMKKGLWDACGEIAARFDYKPHRLTDRGGFSRETKTIEKTGQRKRIVFITGMHRSGTSFLSRALNLCGLNLPNPDIVGNPANEKGRWENKELSLAARRLFGPMDRWYDPVVIDDTDDVLEGMRNVLLKYHQVFDTWGWKDPRTLITFAYWKRLIPKDTRFDMVVSVRNPHEVAQSLRKRNGFTLEEGIRLWERYNSHVLNYIEKGYPVHLFNFNAADKRAELNRICERLGLTPDDSLWGSWFDERLVHHADSRMPGSSIYRRLMASWRKQAGQETDAANIAVGSIKPPLSLAILMVNGRYNYKDRLWVEKAVSNVIKHTSAYRDYRIFLWNHDHENQTVREYLADSAPYVEVLDETTFDIHSFNSPKYAFAENNILNYHGFHIHRTPLQILYEYASENYAVDTFFTLDSDSWPIRPNWDVHILATLNNGAKLTGVWRDEMASAIEPFVHASGLGVKAGTIRETGLRFDTKPDGPHEDTLSHFTRQIQQRFGINAIHPLKRSNQKQYHAVYGGIYGDLIYHHHQGTIYRGGDQQGLLFKGSADRGERAEDNKRLCDALTEMVFFNYDDYMNEILYGEIYEQLKIVFYLFRNRNDKRRIQYLLQLAKADIEDQPLISYFILNLVIRYHSFNPPVLRLMAEACHQLGLIAEARQYETLALQALSIQADPCAVHEKSQPDEPYANE